MWFYTGWWYGYAVRGFTQVFSSAQLIFSSSGKMATLSVCVFLLFEILMLYNLHKLANIDTDSDEESYSWGWAGHWCNEIWSRLKIISHQILLVWRLIKLLTTKMQHTLINYIFLSWAGKVGQQSIHRLRRSVCVRIYFIWKPSVTEFHSRQPHHLAEICIFFGESLLWPSFQLDVGYNIRFSNTDKPEEKKSRKSVIHSNCLSIR